MNLRNAKRVMFLAVVVLVSAAGVASAVLPSGNGQTTMNKSVSVAVASDQTVPVSGTVTVDIALLKQPTRTAAVTPSDATDVTATCTKGIWVGTGGNVAVKGAGDSSANTLPSVPSGTYVPGAYSRIMSTNSTASGIVCFYGP